MTRSTVELETVMGQAVEVCITNVNNGGLPFVGVVVNETGVISKYGVNRVWETQDPTAHAEIIAMRDAMESNMLETLTGTTLLATGEPCGLCYRFAIEHNVQAIYVAVDRDEVADLGFDYRESYSALRISDGQRAELFHYLPVERGFEPLKRYIQTQTNLSGR